MANRYDGAPRSPNAAVRFSLHQFVEKLGTVFGVKTRYDGPGPIGATDLGGALNPGGVSFAVSYLFSELMTKFDDGKSSTTKEEACLQKFYDAEELCRETNERFQERSFLYRDSTKPGYTPAQALWRARRKMEWLLEDYSDAVIVEGCGFGPGATSRLPRSKSHLSHKLEGNLQATPATVSFARDILSHFPGWEESFIKQGTFCEVVKGNRLVTVPKNYKTDRMIAIEPDWNLFIQKGFGHHIRGKLRKVGIELSDQSNNAFLAGLGSIDGSVATIDLSMASDCLSTELVRFLTPPEWFDALEQCRSDKGVLPSGDLITYQKFSSMGNGYTFELETAIFWSICSSVIDLMQLEDRRCLVYGDDIVVPTAAYANVIDALAHAGFVPNRKKSFGEGRFRESCGSHFYEGKDVTPIYIRESVSRLDRLFLLHNNTCRLLERFGDDVVATPEEVVDFLAWIRSAAPKPWQGPRLTRLDIGDGAFFGTFEQCSMHLVKRKKGHSGWRVETLQAKPRLRDTSAREHSKMLASLWSLENRTVPLLTREELVLKWYGVSDRILRFNDSPPRDPHREPWELTWRVGGQTVDGHAFYPWWAFCLAAH